MVQENVAVHEEEPLLEDGLKNKLTEYDLKQMNEDLNIFVQSQIMST
jgi:hypothetical protein